VIQAAQANDSFTLNLRSGAGECTGEWWDFLNLRNTPQRGKLSDPTPIGGWTCHPIPVGQVSLHVLRDLKTCRVLDDPDLDESSPGGEIPRM
jgi:hypothetical protein